MRKTHEEEGEEEEEEGEKGQEGEEEGQGLCKAILLPYSYMHSHRKEEKMKEILSIARNWRRREPERERELEHHQMEGGRKRKIGSLPLRRSRGSL